MKLWQLFLSEKLTPYTVNKPKLAEEKFRKLFSQIAQFLRYTFLR